jgi:hypothetical protein
MLNRSSITYLRRRIRRYITGANQILLIKKIIKIFTLAISYNATKTWVVPVPIKSSVGYIGPITNALHSKNRSQTTVHYIGYHFCFAFGKFSLRISAAKSLIITQAFRVFAQFLQIILG